MAGDERVGRVDGRTDKFVHSRKITLKKILFLKGLFRVSSKEQSYKGNKVCYTLYRCREGRKKGKEKERGEMARELFQVGEGGGL